MRLKRTTERVSEDHAGLTAEDNFIFICHVAAYRFAIDYVRDADVLDLGCGTGFGSAMLAEHARSVVGVDVAPDAVQFSTDRYGDSAGDNLTFRQIGPLPDTRMPFDDASFDVVICFQVIEHIHGVDSFLREIARVIRPGGVLVMATPDRRWRLFDWQKPFNRFHVTEWNPQQMREIMERVFPQVDLFGMTAPPEMLQIELNRCRKLRLVAVPLTLPVIPERVRLPALAVLTHIRDVTRGVIGQLRGRTEHAEFNGREDDITIAPNVSPSTNIIAVARKAN